MHRPSLGIAALILLVAGGVLIARPVEGDPYPGAVALRAGLVLGAIWLALPNLRRAPRWLLIGAAVIVAVIIVRPRLVLYAFPVAVAASFVGALSGSRERR